MATDEPNKEFTINVQFSGVEEDILGVFKKQIEDVAKSITLVNDTMSEATKVLSRVTKELKEMNSGGGGSASSVVSGVSTGGPVASHLATGSTRSGGDGSDMVRAVGDLGKIMEGLTGKSSLFGARGLTAGYRQWDQENSFEIPQFPNSSFTKQDAFRQLGALFGMGGYHSTRSGDSVSVAKLEALHKQRESHPNPNIWRDEDYIEQATEDVPWYLKPWKQQIGHAQGTRDYIGSLGEGYAANNPQITSILQKAQYIAPYFSKGGAFHPHTYGLGLSDFRAKAAAIGSGYGRWDAQFGGDTQFNPFSDSGHEFFGAQWQGARNSWFGLNPFLSSKQAGEIQSSVAGMGYSHGTAESMRNMMSDVTQHTNIGIGDQAAIIDKSFRWGYASLQQLADFMKHDIPQAAQAARLNVGQFSQQLVQVATQLGGSQGTGFFRAAGQITDLTTGLGVDPGTAGQMMGDVGLTMMAATLQAHHNGGGFSVGHLLNSPNAAGLYAEAAATRVRQLTRYSPEEIAKIQRDANNGDAGAIAKRDDISQKLYWLQQSGNAIPGAGSIQEITRLTKNGIRDTNLAAITRNFGEGTTGAYDKAFNKYIKSHDSDGTGWDDVQHAMHAGDAAVKHFANSQFKGSKGRADLIRMIQKTGHLDGWDNSALGDILGHHDVGGSASKFGHHEVVGDSSRSIAQIMAAFHKQIAKNTTDRQGKNSSDTSGKVIISMGPGLSQLLKMAVAPGNAGYGSGQNPPAMSSDPSGGSQVVVGG